MDDADVFNADLVHGKDGGNGSDSAGLICNIQIKHISLADRTIIHNINGITVIPGACKHLINSICLLPICSTVVYRTADLDQHADIVVQNIGNVLMVFHADLLPHNGRGGGNPCNIAETACCDGLHIFGIVVQSFYQIYKGGSNNMGQMAYTCCNKIMFFSCKHHRDSTKRTDQLCKI